MPRALLSVHDKSGLIELARGLHDAGWEMVASGGTAAALRDAQLPVVEVSDVTGFPEILGGRVKTLHPAIHGGILATGSPQHQAELQKHGITPIGLVVCNLYPFAATAATPGITPAQVIEQIDIGGVTLLRAAAKNHASVAVVVDPADYPVILAELQAGIGAATRTSLALKAFGHTAEYDSAIAAWFAGTAAAQAGAPLPPASLTLAQELRYGENPHQRAALYNVPGVTGPLGGQLLHGKPLSYNNLLDLDAAWRVVSDFAAPTVAIIKHTNPCGLASAGSLAEAYPRALAGDPVAAYGGILAVNRPLDIETAQLIGKLFLECIVAPGFEPEALELLSGRPNIRLLAVGNTLPHDEAQMRSVRGGVLVQDYDNQPDDESEWRVVTRLAPTEAQWRDLRFAWKAAKHLKSNAISVVRDEALLGAGTGQMSRIDSVRIAAVKAAEKAAGAVLGSDAYFPFPDGVEEAAIVGIHAVIQPGGSIRDAEVIAAADANSTTMVFTGRRHFRH